VRKGERGSTLVRLLTAFSLIPAVLLLIWLPQLRVPFHVSVAALALAGLYEYLGMTAELRLATGRAGAYLLCAALVAAAALAGPATMAFVLSIGLPALAALHILRGRQNLAGLAAAVFGVLYTGWLAAHFVLLHRIPETGPALVTLLLAAVACSDTGAYFTGRAIGRHKMTPRLSPNKTWEGAAGGLILAALSMLVVFFLRSGFGWSAFPAWRLPQYLAIGVLLSVTGQMGDLAESMMKRDAGVKDAGSIFPGHGGVLDRCDGYLFSGPVLYYLVTAPPLF
jgi:phosphatidate cytidylyltransferase